MGRLFCFLILVCGGFLLADAAEPINVTTRAERDLAASSQWSEVQGKVIFAGKSVGKLTLELTTASGRITAEVPDTADISLPLLLHGSIRVRGMRTSAYTVDGYQSSSRLLAPGTDQLTMLEVGSKHWSTYPVATLSQASAGSIVRLRGSILAIENERKIVLEDPSGQVTVQLIQPFREPVGASIEALGEWRATGTNTTLFGAVWRRANEFANGITLPLLTATEEVHALKPEDAKAQYPVRIRGVVTSRDADGGMVQDATRGVYVFGLKTTDESRQVAVSDYVEVEGVTMRGTFAPMIQCKTVRRLGDGLLPTPAHATWARLNNGSMDCQYIELEGFVTEAYPRTLVLLLPEGAFGIAIVPNAGADFADYDLPRYANKHVRIRGTVFATRNNETRRVLSGSIGLGNAVISVREPLVTLDKKIGELLQFDARAAAIHRVKVTGQILHARAGDYYLSDGSNALRFLTRATQDLSPGDLVEVIGFPRLAGSSAVLYDATAQTVRAAPLPPGRSINHEALSNSGNIGALIDFESRLMGIRSNRTDIMLDLQAGSRSLVARLGPDKGELAPLPIGSRLRVKGLYAGHRRDPVTGAETDFSELLLNSANDIQVLERPSWWTPARAVSVISSLMGVLLLGAAWVVGLRRQVEVRTAELRGEIEERKRMEGEVQQVHKKLVDASRKAGMAQIATGVLHNVGNVLNSVNVSANVLTENTKNSRIQSLTKVATLLEDHRANLADFLGNDPRGQRIPRLLRNMEGHFRKEQSLQLRELDDLKKHIEHVKESVAMQQNYARNPSTLYEEMSLIEVVEDALRIQAAAFVRHEIAVVREYAPLQPFFLDRHKVLQILVNLLNNARDACDLKGPGNKRVTVRVMAPEQEHVTIEVEDTGAGIAPDNLQRIFNYGFTTRAKGHGYGLHSSANAAAEMRSSLSVRSEGTGKGAVFTLRIPWLQNAELPPVAVA